MNMQRRILMGSMLAAMAALAQAAAPQTAAPQDVIDMKGKVALVTGSTSGLGEVAARRLGAMGATVLVHGLNEERGQQIAAEITKTGPGKGLLLRR